MHLYPHVGVDVATEELDYKHYELHEPNIALPLKIFECAPIKNGVITFTLQVQTETEMSVVISGNTYPYRQQLTNAGAEGGYADQDDKSSYLRRITNIDVTRVDDKEKLFKVLGKDVLNDLAVRVLIDGEIADGSEVDSFIKELKSMSNLHFQ